MRNTLVKNYYLVLLLIFSLSSCRAIGTIFKAGVWVGIVAVLAVVFLIIWLVSRARK